MYKILSYIAIIVAFVASGYYLAAKRYEAKFEEFRAEQAQAVIKQQEEFRKQERERYAQVSTIQSNLADGVADVIKSYNTLNDSIDSFDVNSMLNNQDSATVTEQVSTTTSTTSRVQDCRCERTTVDRARLQRLYKRQLIVARDCDITATHYNQLIKLYNSIYASQIH